MIRVPECTMYVLGRGKRTHGQVFSSCDSAQTVRWPPNRSRQKKASVSIRANILYALLSLALQSDSLPYQLSQHQRDVIKNSLSKEPESDRFCDLCKVIF